jgi:hypothetical protein
MIIGTKEKLISVKQLADKTGIKPQPSYPVAYFICRPLQNADNLV